MRPHTNSEHLLREQTAEQISCRGFTFTAQLIYGTVWNMEHYKKEFQKIYGTFSIRKVSKQVPKFGHTNYEISQNSELLAAPVLRIRVVNPGSRGQKRTGSRIRNKIWSIFNPKIVFSFWIHDPGCLSRIPGSEKHWIPDPDPQHWAGLPKYKTELIIPEELQISRMFSVLCSTSSFQTVRAVTRVTTHDTGVSVWQKKPELYRYLRTARC